MNVNPGELNKRIQVFKKDGARDADGYETGTPSLTHSCWAKFTRTSGTEMTKANADFGEVKARFLIRFTKKKLDRKMMIRYAGDDYEIVYINDYEDSHEYMEIWCKRLTQEG